MSDKKRAQPSETVEAEVKAEIAAMSRAIKNFVEERLPGFGFVVLLGKLGEGGYKSRMSYTSSIQREDTIRLLREMADVLEQSG